MHKPRPDTSTFYASPDIANDLESPLSVIPPGLADDYRKLETVASEAFLDRYGEYLSAEQQEHFRSNATLFIDPYDVTRLKREVDTIDTVDAHDSPIDGVAYLAYSVGSPENAAMEVVRSNDTEMPSSPTNLWAGRLAIYGLAPDEIHDVDPKWLMTQDAFEQATDKLPFKERWDSIPKFVFTNEVAHVGLHEKVHAHQDEALPLPILEAAAHYYERAVAKEEGWFYEKDNNMQLFADLYADCVKELGDDVHRLTFGNLTTERREEVLASLKQKFTPAVIEGMSKAGSPHRHIYWTTISATELETPH
ncbi:hypothetical protein EYC59_03310 [Candidatus Saccharibacteria bacterium]|nr:MAG: hypothetical protein EYC59_03310 [Candidatus Saccharibacteria bacterium]